jgi:hypothetical protein
VLERGVGEGGVVWGSMGGVTSGFVVVWMSAWKGDGKVV